MKYNKKYIIIAVMILFLAAAGPARADDRIDKVQNVYFRALQAFESGEYLKGVQLYYRFVIIGNMALSKAVRAHDLAKAMGYFKKMVVSGKNDQRVELGIVLVERIIERFDRAEKRLDLLREKFPNSVMLAFLKGELALSGEDEELAVQIFGTMNRLPKPRGFPALANYLLKLRGRGGRPNPTARRRFFMKIAYRRWDEMDFDGARKIFNMVMNEFPEDPEAPRALVDLLLQLDKSDDAVKVIDAWKLMSDIPLIAPLPLARIKYSQGLYEEALTLLKPLQEADPQDSYLKLLTAESLYQMDRLAAAAPYFKELAAADTKNQGFLQRLIVCAEAAGRRGEALPLLEAYVNANPKDSMMRFEYASLLVRLERLNDARFQFNIIRGYGNPLQERALKQIDTIDRANYVKLMSSATSNVSGVPPQADNETVSEPAVSAGGGTGQVEEEQIRRMTELFKE